MGQGHAVVALAVALGSCSGSEPWGSECGGWTWLEEEACLMDTCAEQAPECHFLDSECRDGECWCCNEADGCWFSGRILTD